MKWNLNFEYFSLIITLLVLFDFLRRKIILTQKNKSYLMLIISAILTIVVNIISSNALNNIDTYSIHYVRSVNNIYIMTILLTPACFAIYVKNIMDETKTFFKKNYRVLLFFIPCLLNIFLAILNVYTHCLFTITNNGDYTITSLYYVINYFSAFIYFGHVFVILLKNKFRIPAFKRVATFSFIFIATASTIVQFFIPKILITGLAIMLPLVIIHITFQNAEQDYDLSTNIFNRHSFNKIIYLLMQKKIKGSTIIINFNNIKFVSEMFGEENLNLVFLEVVNYLKSDFPNNKICKLSNDAFAIISNKEQKNISREIEKLKKRFESTWLLVNKTQIDLDITIYIISYPESSTNFEEIMKTADYIVHPKPSTISKDVIWVDNKLIEEIKRSEQIAFVIEKAILREKVVTFYQPIYNIKTNSFSSAEALMRLYDEELGIISPNEFIPIAEKSGHIIKLGLLVLENSCKAIIKLRYNGIKIDYISVNLSIVQFMQENLADNISDILNKYSLTENDIRFEVTETATVSSFPVFKNSIQRLIEKNYRIAIDDFGEGVANLNYLINLPFRGAKIDKKITDLIGDKDLEIIFDLVVNIIKNLKLLCIVEGVETIEQVEKIKSLDCDFIQGFYYAKPMSENDVLQFLYNRQLDFKKGEYIYENI